MSRSFRKVKIFGNAGGSDKKDKMKASRKMRRVLKERIRCGGEEEASDNGRPRKQEFSDTYNFTKDGKGYWKDATTKDMVK